MTEAADNPKRFQNLTNSAIKVLVLAAVSAILDPVMFDGKPEHRLSAGQSAMIQMPHLLVLASLSSALRVLGEVLAVLVGIAFFLLGAFMVIANAAESTPGPLVVSAVLASIQLVIIVFAAPDIWNSRKLKPQPIERTHRFLGLGVPLGVLLLSAFAPVGGLIADGTVQGVFMLLLVLILAFAIISYLVLQPHD